MFTNFIILAYVFKKILVIGLEPILFFKKSDFKSDVSTDFHQTSYLIKMAQFDFIITGSMLFILITATIVYYTIALTIILPNFFGAKKFRCKKFNFLLIEGSNPAYSRSSLY